MSTARHETVQCPRCGHDYGPAGAAWCGCLTEDRSLVCPKCSRCFCDRPVDWKRKFWANAPPHLRKSHRDANKTDYAPPRFLLRDEVKRPLILVAEDNLLVHLLATRMITKIGYGVVGAMNGREAIELARLYEPDLILSDALMPIMDGREMCRTIKSDPILGGTKVVIFSSVYKDAAYEKEAKFQFKADDYLTKPVSEETMRTTLKKHVGGPAART